MPNFWGTKWMHLCMTCASPLECEPLPTATNNVQCMAGNVWALFGGKLPYSLRSSLTSKNANDYVWLLLHAKSQKSFLNENKRM